MKPIMEFLKATMPVLVGGIGATAGTYSIHKKNIIDSEIKRLEILSKERIAISEIESKERIELLRIKTSDNSLFERASESKEIELLKIEKIPNYSPFDGASDSVLRSPLEPNSVFYNSIIEIRNYMDSFQAIELYALSVLLFSIVIMWCLFWILIDGFIYNNILINSEKKNKLIKVLMNLYRSVIIGMSYYYFILINISLFMIIIISAFMLFS